MKKYALLASLLAFVPSAASAETTVIMNGINITGVYNQKFSNVNIEFDAEGNIIIDAPQYKVVDRTPTSLDPTATKVVEQGSAVPMPSPAAAPAIVPSHQYNVLPDDPNPTWLVATFNYPGLLGYNINLYINNTFVKTIHQGQPQAIVDITTYLVKGQNTIEYRLDMAADSGTSSKATVEFSLSKQIAKTGTNLDLSGQYATLLIKGADGTRNYTVNVIVP